MREHGSRVVGAGMLLVAVAIAASGVVYRNYMDSHVDPTVYTPLLNVIAKGESRGNYNAYYGNAHNFTVRFTEMPVADVLKWQQDYLAKGSPSSAVGKYQIIRPTLAELVKQLKIDPHAPFDAKLQDRMAVALLEKRGVRDYMENRMSRDQFAANLSQEWAALPRANGATPSQSYYEGDGVNHSQVSIKDIYTALASLHAR